MVSKTLLFSCIVSLVHLVVSEVSPPQADIGFDGRSDLSSNPSLGHIQELLSRHITDLSALLNNFTSSVSTPIGTGRPILQPPQDDSVAAASACDCTPPIESTCQIACGTHHGDGPRDPPDHSSNNVATDTRPLAGLLPLRLSCTCSPPVALSCKILCADHGGTVWTPPKDVKLAPFSSESTQARLQLQQDHLADTGSDSALPPCDCTHPTPQCRILCANHGGDSVDPPDDAPADAIPHPIPKPGQGNDGQTSPQPPTSPDPSQPGWESCDCANPTPGSCQILCANHGGRANGSDDVKLQNASMPWPATGSLREFPTASDESSTLHRTLTLTVQTSPDSSTPINAEVDLSSYASFATHSAITALNLAGEILPLTQPPSQAQTVSIHSQQQKVVGTVALQLPEYRLHEVFYVVESEPQSTGASETAAHAESIPDFIVGVDFLLQIGGLAVGSHLLA